MTYANIAEPSTIKNATAGGGAWTCEPSTESVGRQVVTVEGPPPCYGSVVPTADNTTPGVITSVEYYYGRTYFNITRANGECRRCPAYNVYAV